MSDQYSLYNNNITHLNSEVLTAGIDHSAKLIEAGARKFVDFAKAMIADMGYPIRPYLKQFYLNVLYSPDYHFEGMDSIYVIERADIEKILASKEDLQSFQHKTQNSNDFYTNALASAIEIRAKAKGISQMESLKQIREEIKARKNNQIIRENII